MTSRAWPPGPHAQMHNGAVFKLKSPSQSPISILWPTIGVSDYMNTQGGPLCS
jgi:hypothetical protein